MESQGHRSPDHRDGARSNFLQSATCGAAPPFSAGERLFTRPQRPLNVLATPIAHARVVVFDGVRHREALVIAE